MDAVDRTYINARAVFRADARLANDIRHAGLLDPGVPRGSILEGASIPRRFGPPLPIWAGNRAGFTAPVTFYGWRNEKTAVPQVGYDPPQFHVRF
jgi:hypothetical protein